MQIVTINIPKSKTYSYQTTTAANRIRDFLAILKRWANRGSKNIPYVWGGCSFTQLSNTDTFCVKQTSTKGKSSGFYERPGHISSPKTGFDCSSIIARAAQIVGIPYFFKNTYTLAQKLKTLSPNESFCEGDLIWLRGHVMVVANLQQNTIIEANAYGGGYGKVHEIQLKKVFGGIKTFRDLCIAFQQNKPLTRLNSQGKIYETYKQCKLLKLASVWS